MSSMCEHLNEKEWKLLELQTTQARHPHKHFGIKKISKFNTPQKKETFIKCA